MLQKLHVILLIIICYIHRSGICIHVYPTEYFTLQILLLPAMYKIQCNTVSISDRVAYIVVKVMGLFTKLAEQCGSLSDPVVLWL